MQVLHWLKNRDFQTGALHACCLAACSSVGPLITGALGPDTPPLRESRSLTYFTDETLQEKVERHLHDIVEADLIHRLQASPSRLCAHIIQICLSCILSAHITVCTPHRKAQSLPSPHRTKRTLRPLPSCCMLSSGWCCCSQSKGSACLAPPGDLWFCMPRSFCLSFQCLRLQEEREWEQEVDDARRAQVESREAKRVKEEAEEPAEAAVDEEELALSESHFGRPSMITSADAVCGACKAC